MAAFNELSLHNVVKVEVGSVLHGGIGENRWQDLVIHQLDGSQVTVSCFLHPKYAGLGVAQLEVA
jgi:hypothetical protein